jgi:WD40 repeat protein
MTGNRILTYKGHRGGIFAVAWSPNSAYIASAGEDTTVQVWNATTGGDGLTYVGVPNWDTSITHGRIFTVAWSPDGRHIAFGGYDKAVQVWQVG